MRNIISGQKRFDGVPAKSAANSVSQGGFPLEHQNLKGAKPPSKNGIKPFWGGAPRPAEGRSRFGHPARRVFCGVSCPARSMQLNYDDGSHTNKQLYKP